MASFAQARIWLDERIRFDSGKPQVAIYNMPFLYHIESGRMSISRLRRAFQQVVLKHEALRTALLFDGDKQQLRQRIVDAKENEELFTFVDSRFDNDDNLLTTLMHEERGSPVLFDLGQGRVSRLHVVRRHSTDNSWLSEGDAIIFNFHHALFDFPSMHIFHRDLNQAYVTGQLEWNNKNELRYLDCRVDCRCFHHSSVHVFRCDW